MIKYYNIGNLKFKQILSIKSVLFELLIYFVPNNIAEQYKLIEQTNCNRKNEIYSKRVYISSQI